MSPILVVIAFAAICAAAFAVGLRFYRMTEAPGADVSVAQARRFGRLLMMAATGMLLFVGAAWLHGDLKFGAAQ